jgi:hypothetical protein
MPKKHHKRRHLKGGFLGLGSLEQTFSNLGTSISQGASSLWDKTKKITGLDTSSSSSTYTPSTYTSSPSPSTYTASTSTSTSSTPYSYGGKRLRKKTKRSKSRSKTMKRGGNFSANEPINSLASRAAPFTGLTARVHDLVGGKKNKSRRARR